MGKKINQKKYDSIESDFVDHVTWFIANIH